MTMKIDELDDNNGQGVPGFNGKGTEFSPKDYRVRYYKADLDDPGCVAMLEKIETDSLKEDKRVLLLSKDKFSFQTGYFIVVSYLEHRSHTTYMAQSEPNAELEDGPSIEELSKKS